jgi:hypothetical protein
MIQLTAPYHLGKVLSEPPARLCLVYGTSLVFKLANYLILQKLAQEETVVFLDGGNRFDPYRITEAARIMGQSPEEFLRRIKISRAFTCHQMESLIKKARLAVRRLNGSLVVLSGFLNTFYDEDVPAGEASRLARTSLRNIAALGQEGTPVLAVCPHLATPTKRDFLSPLKKSADRVISCLEREDGYTVIRQEKPASLKLEWVIPGGGEKWAGRF